MKDPEPNDPELGPLKLLPGKWANVPNLQGRGWNMIALPFVAPPPQGVPFSLNYRLLVNQYNEELEFTLVDKAVPNRGVRLAPGIPANTDQFLVTLDYQQSVKPIAADDFPKSGLAGPAGAAIHHEPGLWLHMTNGITDSLNIARLASIPHGDSVLALGQSSEHVGSLSIPDINGLPIGADQDLKNPYLAPSNILVTICSRACSTPSVRTTSSRKRIKVLRSNAPRFWMLTQRIRRVAW